MRPSTQRTKGRKRAPNLPCVARRWPGQHPPDPNAASTHRRLSFPLRCAPPRHTHPRTCCLSRPPRGRTDPTTTPPECPPRTTPVLCLFFSSAFLQFPPARERRSGVVLSAPDRRFCAPLCHPRYLFRTSDPQSSAFCFQRRRQEYGAAGWRWPGAHSGFCLGGLARGMLPRKAEPP